MGNIYLLDCTLRDGGYVNDWKFGRDNIVSIFERVVDAGIDIIEIGFGNRQVKVEITEIVETTRKDEAKDMFRYV